MGRLERKNVLRYEEAIKMWYDFCEENLQDFCVFSNSEKGVNFWLHMYFPKFDGNHVRWYETLYSEKGIYININDLNMYITREQWITMTVIEVMTFINGYGSKYHHLGKAVEEGIFDRVFEKKENKSLNEYIGDGNLISREDANAILEGLKEYIMN